eukprot:831432-Prorocentrum_minimum.AAC.2
MLRARHMTRSFALPLLHGMKDSRTKRSPPGLLLPPPLASGHNYLPHSSQPPRATGFYVAHVVNMG